MKNLFFILLIFLIAETELQSQDEPSFLNFETSVQTSFHSIEYNHLGELLRQINRYSFSFGAGIQQSALLSVSKKLRFSGGIGFHTFSYGIKINNELLHFSDFLGESYTPISTDSITTLRKIQYTSNYFNIPMKVRFILYKRPRFQFFAEVGINHLFLLKSSTKIKVLEIPGRIGLSGLFLTNTNLPASHGLNQPISDFFDQQIEKYALDGIFNLGYEYKFKGGDSDVWMGLIFSYQQSIVAKNNLMRKINGLNIELKTRYPMR